MLELIDTLSGTPVPTILVVAGKASLLFRLRTIPKRLEASAILSPTIQMERFPLKSNLTISSSKHLRENNNYVDRQWAEINR